MDEFYLKLVGIIAWFDKNKEWLFSGIGLSVITLIYKGGIWLKKKASQKAKREKNPEKSSTIGEKEADNSSSYFFGHFPDSDTVLKWIIVQKEKNELLLLCKNIICEKEYDVIEKRNWRKKDEELSWDSSSLCNYLNGYFLEHAFDTAEREHIICKNYQFISLLNRTELENVPINDRYGRDSTGTGKEWWLNTPGIYRKENIMYVDVNGKLDTVGYKINKEIGVRPALWIRI